MSKVLLRDVIPEDDLGISLWQPDDELRRLNPNVGRAFNYGEYAIEVAGTHIGFCSVCDVTQGEAELGVAIDNKVCYART